MRRRCVCCQLPLITSIALGIIIGATVPANAFDITRVVVLNTGSADAVESAVKGAGLIPLTIDRPTTLSDLVATECPGASADYLAGFSSDVATANPDLFTEETPSLATAIGEKGAFTIVYVPYCLGAFTERRVTEPGDTLWGIWNERKDSPYGVKDWNFFLEEARRLNGEDVDKRMLPPNKPFAVPTAAWDVPVSTNKLPNLLTELQQNGVYNDVAVMNNPGMGSETNASDACVGSGNVPSEEQRYGALERADAQLWDLAETLSLNEAIDNISPGWKRENATIKVGVLDHGITAPVVEPLMKKVLRKFPGFSDVEGRALPDDPKMHHGTGVLVTAVGGPMLSVLNLNPDGPGVVAAAFNLLQKVCPDTCYNDAPDIRLDSAMRVAFDPRSEMTAVNLSMSYPHEPSGFGSYLGPNQPVLIVTSAGNSGQNIEIEPKIYPANYGGSEDSNLITVAAVDFDHELLSDSDWSNRVVDIAAWGCNIPVAEYPAVWAREFRSGTSYAAPQVLFVAAMIKREEHVEGLELSPADIKVRLVASADFKPTQLWKRVKHGRVLNLAKALSVHTDVVELKGGELLRGQVRFDPQPNDDGPPLATQQLDLCDGAPQIVRSELLNVVYLGESPPEGAKRFLLYRWGNLSSGQSRRVETEYCDFMRPLVHFEDPLDKSKSRDIEWSEISTVVMATLPYWGQS